MNSKLLIALALLAIAAGGYGLFAPASSPPAQSMPVVEPKPLPAKQWQVWLARHPLEKGQPITRLDLELHAIDESQALALGVNQNITINFTPEMRITQRLEKGAVVWPELLLVPNQPGYIDLILTPDHVPFPIQVKEESIIGGVIQPGSLVDILALASLKQNLANDETVRSFETVSLTPVLMGVKVLQVNQSQSSEGKGRNELSHSQASVILELNRKQVATLTIARHIAQLEIHLSTGNQKASELSANAGDVLTDYKAIHEYRANKATVR
ncbi:Flp pilus assembly protein CpaB [Vibrio cincinnatiensis]|uniref:Flp pilus assembly protein CpaB n=1 Tax=Vibrio cincinnatiensis TaxID=675 RepID=UPI0012ACBEC3|nr:Flp pilus assembly protein CpaB [Vibrio cincinnatiensis]MCG3747784.1 Flp pilus assembly protein CpaB [Vibrio cincinnatiensis]